MFQKNNCYSTLDNYRTEKYINDMFNELTDKWGISQSHAIKLLKKYNFNKERANRNLEEDAQFDMMDIPVNSKSKEVY